MSSCVPDVQKQFEPGELILFVYTRLVWKELGGNFAEGRLYPIKLGSVGLVVSVFDRTDEQHLYVMVDNVMGYFRLDKVKETIVHV